MHDEISEVGVGPLIAFHRGEEGFARDRRSGDALQIRAVTRDARFRVDERARACLSRRVPRGRGTRRGRCDRDARLGRRVVGDDRRQRCEAGERNVRRTRVRGHRAQRHRMVAVRGAERGGADARDVVLRTREEDDGFRIDPEMVDQDLGRDDDLASAARDADEDQVAVRDAVCRSARRVSATGHDRRVRRHAERRFREGTLDAAEHARIAGTTDREREARECGREIGLVVFHLFFAERVAQALRGREQIDLRALHRGRPDGGILTIEQRVEVRDRADRVARAPRRSDVLAIVATDEAVARAFRRRDVRRVTDRRAVFDPDDIGDRRADVGKRGTGERAVVRRGGPGSGGREQRARDHRECEGSGSANVPHSA